MDEPNIVFEHYAAMAQRELVEEIINRRHVRLTGHDEWHPVAFFLKTGEGEILGGLLGQIWARWLWISTLAVRERFRGLGYGPKLLARAEQYALGSGCSNAWLSTFSFQARPFYERFGNRVFGTLEDYPKDHSLFFMTKQLVSPQGVQAAF
ncbi:MAG: GNAT family N-acetyltransferase [Deltaproteobacteria bacterium]|nr:GNAT family N-acetyltransferase [Deltaproteobacteria bacterium]